MTKITIGINFLLTNKKTDCLDKNKCGIDDHSNL